MARLNVEYVGDEVVGKDEAARAYLAALRKDFDLVDRDRNGEIDLEELRTMLKLLYSPSAAEIDAFVRHFDANRDGRITQAEFLGGLAKLNPSPVGRHEREDKARRLFARYDANGDGSLTGDEINKLAQETLMVPDEALDRAITTFDVNGDKRISFAEFVRASLLVEGGLVNIWDSSLLSSVRDPNLVKASLALQVKN